MNYRLAWLRFLGPKKPDVDRGLGFEESERRREKKHVPNSPRPTCPTPIKVKRSGYGMRTMFLYGLVATSIVNGDPLPPLAQAEWYLSGYGGMVFPGSLGTVTDSQQFGRLGATSAARTSDVDLEQDLALGAKAGYFFQDRKWLGLETEVFTFTPNITQQPIIVGQPGQPAFGATIPGSHLRVTTWALNVMTRDTTTERFNPYGGLGLGLFYVYSRDHPGKFSASPGLNVLAGARYYVTDQIAVFGEFKFNTAHFTFGGFSGDYSGQMLLGGVAYHFGNPVPRKD